MAAAVVPRHVLDVEDLKEFKSHEVIVRMLIFLCEGIGEEWLYLLHLVFVYQLNGRLITHGARPSFLSSGYLARKRIASFARCLVVEAIGLL